MIGRRAFEKHAMAAMSKLKATWTPTQGELAKMLRAKGFAIIRFKGSHAILKNKSGETALLPLIYPARKASPVVWRSCKRYVDEK